MRVPAHEAESARAIVLSLLPEGFEEVESGDELVLVAYCSPTLEASLRVAFARVEAEDVPAGWEGEWRAFHKPVRIGPLWIGPPWEAPAPDAVPVVVDPGRAFGTGAHATTRLCLEVLLRQPRSSLADLGCGSGVLAIAAAKLGFGPVAAVDCDAAAVDAARANAFANGVEIDVRRGDVLADRLPAATLAVANLELLAVEPLAARVDARRLLVAGILASEHPSLGRRWERRERRELEGWAAELYERRL